MPPSSNIKRSTDCVANKRSEKSAQIVTLGGRETDRGRCGYVAREARDALEEG